MVDGGEGLGALNRDNLTVIDRLLAPDFKLFVPPYLGEGRNSRDTKASDSL